MTQNYDLERFLRAQEPSYERALREIVCGRKQTHWMWYIFPQLKGLGTSPTSRFYGIADAEEARAYLMHPVLGARLREITEALLRIPHGDPVRVMGHPDDRKLHSSMTLFMVIAEDGSLFKAVLDHFYGGEPDGRTLSMLGEGL